MCGSCGRKINLDQQGSSTRSHSSLQAKPTAKPTRFGTHAAMDGSVVAFETQEAWVQHLEHATEDAAHRALRRRKRVIGGMSSTPTVRAPENALSRQQSSVEVYERSFTSTTPGYMQPRRARTGIPGNRCGKCDPLECVCEEELSQGAAPHRLSPA